MSKNEEYMPNQKWHRNISMIKSIIRLLGYGALPFNLILSAVFLMVAEIFGIVEELV